MLASKILSKKHYTLYRQAFRSFGGASHGDHGHEVEYPDKDTNFTPDTAADKKFIALKGLRSNEINVIPVENQSRHMKGLSIFNLEQPFSSTVGGHLTYEEELLHGEPYGYFGGDDPFDPNGRAEIPAGFFLLAGSIILHLSFSLFRFRKVSNGQIWMHERVTAGMIEDEIRKIRLEDYEVRYAE